MKPDDKVNILAVDDSPEKLLAISALLSELNQNVVTATSGRDALRFLLHQEFAVVLLDVNMPGMDGFETAALIRQRKSSQHTPIIFVTSYGDDTHASRGYSLGAVDYILAPVEPEVLKTKVMVFVELYRKTAQVRLQAQSLERRALQLQELTRASLAINSALSLDRMLQVVTDHAREILGAHQAVAVAAADQKWSAPRSATSLSRKYEHEGERPVLRDRAALLALLSRLRKTIRLTRADLEGSSRWEEYLAGDRPLRLDWLAAPLAGRDGRTMGVLHLLDKIEGAFTEEDEAILTQLAQMCSIAMENTLNAEAREANRIKDEFLTTLSHELRTPLSAILGWTRTLRAGKLGPEKTGHGLEVIERNVLAQTRLIDDLLDVSRIITGKLRLQVRPTLLLSVVEAAIEAVRPAADAREIEIDLQQGDPGREDHVLGDPDRLQQVLWNLLSNAIKFTPPKGKVEVLLALAGPSYEICVRDTGRGIEPEFLPRVFERFHQADSSTTRTHGGLGIGLAIARHLVELHGGSISAQSEGKDRGSTFVVHLPRVAVGVTAPERPAAVFREALPAQTHGAADLSRLRILVIEDEPDSRELIVETLRLCGGEVAAASSAREALQFLEKLLPDVLVSDIGMPEQDGYELIRQVRQLPPERGGKVPALALSAYVREEDRLRARSAGFQRHLAKPFEPADLIACVAQLAGLNGRSPAPDPKAFGEKGSRDETASDASLPRILVVEDDRDSREGLRSLLEVWGHAVEVAGSGVEGIEMALQQRPEIALIDIGLPGLDGYEVAGRIREALGRAEIFLVALTGYAGEEDRERALASGFDAHLSKPVNASKLSSLLSVPTR